MYIVKYGDDYLHDPRAGVFLSEAVVELEVNTSDIFTFSITQDHPLYSRLLERDQNNPVMVLDDGEIIFRGEIITIEMDFYMTKSVECRGELAYLNDTLVRPYSTYEGEAPTTAPNDVNGYFQFLIEEHNAQSDKQFIIGVLDGDSLDPNDYIYRSSTVYPTVGNELKDKILDSLGGYISLVYNPDGTRTISLLHDFSYVNTQVIDFGVNLLDFVKSTDFNDICSYVIPLGAYSDDTTDDQLNTSIDITSIEDGILEDGYVKYYDYVVSLEAVNRYGWIGHVINYNDVNTPSYLVRYALNYLKEMEKQQITIEIKAVDLSLIDPEYESIKLGQYIRVRSDAHNYDGYMLLSKLSIDLIKAENDTFTLGTVQSTLTSQSSKTVSALNDSMTNSIVNIQRDVSEIRQHQEGDYSDITDEINSLSDSLNALSTNLSTNYYTQAQVNNKLKTFGGRNYLWGTKDWLGTWANKSSWAATGYFNDLAVMKKSSTTNWLYQDVTVFPGVEYSFSAYIRYSGSGTVRLVLDNGSNSSLFNHYSFDIQAVDSFKQYSCTFTVSEQTTARCRVEATDDSDLYICGYKLERGSIISDWFSGPDDVYRACTDAEYSAVETLLGI